VKAASATSPAKAPGLAGGSPIAAAPAKASPGAAGGVKPGATEPAKPAESAKPAEPARPGAPAPGLSFGAGAKATPPAAAPGASTLSAGAGPKPGSQPAAAEPAPAPPAQEEPTPAPKPFEPLGAVGLSNSRSQGKSGLFDIPGPGGGLGSLLPRAPSAPKSGEPDAKPGVKPNPRDKKP
jgi:hypothetical protein